MPVGGFFQGGAPTAPATDPDADLLAAVKLALRVDGDLTDSQLTRNIAAAVERADRQAPGAPASTRTEAIIRFVSYLHDGIALDAYPSPSLWRRSGAMGLLAPWTVRRAGAIAETD